MTACFERLLETGSCELGELTLRRDGSGVLVMGPGSGPDAPEAPREPESFRRWIRESDAGLYRPLSGARSLRHNWVRHCPDAATAQAVVEVIYPLALRHMALAARGSLKTAAWADVAGRQRGMYAAAAGLGSRGRAVAREVLCAGCVRGPVWAEALTDEGPASIPCPEPCGVLLALCRAAAAWERDPPRPRAADPGVRFADFGTSGNAVRETYLVRRASEEPDPIQL